MEHKEAKNNQSEQGGKRIEKNEDTISSLWDNSKMSSIRTTGVPEGEEKEQYLFEKIILKKLPSFSEGNRHASPGSTESTQQDVRKEDHSKTHRN